MHENDIELVTENKLMDEVQQVARVTQWRDAVYAEVLHVLVISVEITQCVDSLVCDVRDQLEKRPRGSFDT